MSSATENFLVYNSVPGMSPIPVCLFGEESAPSQLPGEGPVPAGQAQTAAGAALTSHLGCETQLVGGAEPVQGAVNPPSRGMGRLAVDSYAQAVPPPPKYPEIGELTGQNGPSVGASLLPTSVQSSGRRKYCHFDLGEEGGNLVFSLSFKDTYPEEVQKLGPLSIRGSISLVVKGPMDWQKQEKLEEDMKATLAALVTQFKNPFEQGSKEAPPTFCRKGTRTFSLGRA